MNWHDDPEVQRKLQERAAHNRLIRSAITWSPFFLLSAGALVFFTFDRAFLDGDHGGTWFLVVILAILTILFGFQGAQSVLDLFRGQPTSATDFVGRRWARSDSFVMRSHYIRLDKMILRGDGLILDGIREGDYVEARYYPHSAMLVWVEKREPPEEAERPGRSAFS